MQLQNRVAIVTGAGRGIGAAVARAFAAEGARVAACDLDIKLARQVAERIDDTGKRTLPFGHDVSVPADCDRLVTDTVTAFGGVDVLVNCAAICPRISVEEMTGDAFDAIVSANLKSVFFLSRAAGEVMRARGWGRIVNISSIGGRTGGIHRATVYAATKAGVISMTKAFARHYAPYGIRVNCTAPGTVDTRLMRNISKEALRAQVDAVPLKRLSTPEEQAAVVLFLASEQASYVTGATLDVNGGSLMPD